MRINPFREVNGKPFYVLYLFQNIVDNCCWAALQLYFPVIDLSLSDVHKSHTNASIYTWVFLLNSVEENMNSII